MERPEEEPQRHRAADRTARAYRAALDRLMRGEPTHPRHAGRTVKITPASVAREAGLSRNPLYTTHRMILAEIATTTVSGACLATDLAAEIERLKAEIVALRAAARRHAKEQRMLATENLSLLYRARVAEERLASQGRGHMG